MSFRFLSWLLGVSLLRYLFVPGVFGVFGVLVLFIVRPRQAVRERERAGAGASMGLDPSGKMGF